MKNLLYIGLILLTVLFSCNKGDDNSGHNPCTGDETTSYIKSTDLQECKFKTNSYWVLVDSVTNSFDSISIESFNQDFIEDICGNTYELHSFKTISSYSSETTDYVVVAGGLFKDFDGTPNSGTQIYDDYYSTTSMTNYQIEKFDSLVICGRYYKKVLRIEIENDITENNNKSIYYINSEFGFLRHDIYSDNILTSKKILMRMNIVR
ncbi:MAG: hypothetical protein HOO86_04700 [Bacteroidales bacterium]|nr:hypothetical protein [Bacteroidales bacterium]